MNFGAFKASMTPSTDRNVFDPPEGFGWGRQPSLMYVHYACGCYVDVDYTEAHNATCLATRYVSLAARGDGEQDASASEV